MSSITNTPIGRNFLRIAPKDIRHPWLFGGIHPLVGIAVLSFCLAGALLPPAFAQIPGAPGVLIGLSLQDTPLGVALKLVADQAGKKFEAHTPLDESVNVNLQGVSLDAAMTKLLEGKPYMWALDADVIHIFRGFQQPSVMPSMPPAPNPSVVTTPEEPLVTRIFPLKKRKAEGMLQLVTNLATKGVKVVADIPTNSLIMIGAEKQIETVASLAREIDETPVTFVAPPPPEDIVSEPFILEFVTEFEEIEKSLRKILYGEEYSTSTELQQTSQLDQLLASAAQSLNRTSTTTVARKEFYLLDKMRRILMITTTRSKMEVIRAYFKQVNTPIAQVLIEAHIVALEDGVDRNLGINWNMEERWGAIFSQPGRTTTTNANTSGNTGSQIGGGFLFGRWDLSNVTSVLQAVQDQNRGQILSQPRLMTLSGKKATIDISTSYPYKSSVTLNQTGTTQNTAFVNVGITLDVTPQVNQQANTVVMQLDPNVSDLISITSDGPVTTQRRTSTNVEVKNGETIVIGGLLRDEDIKSTKVVPFLSKLPVIGDFFKFSQKRKKRTNLMILITPRIVNYGGMSVKKAANAQAPEAPPTVAPAPQDGESQLENSPAAPMMSPRGNDAPLDNVSRGKLLPGTLEEQRGERVPVAQGRTGPGEVKSDFQRRVEQLKTKYMKKE